MHQRGDLYVVTDGKAEVYVNELGDYAIGRAQIPDMVEYAQAAHGAGVDSDIVVHRLVKVASDGAGSLSGFLAGLGVST